MSDQTQTNKLTRMKELVELLNNASKAYYAEDREIMSNYTYDELYEELEVLETELGQILSNSPTVNVGYEVVDELPKEPHEKPMLSLGKTKSREECRDFLGEQTGLLSWKLDGLTIVLTYQEGKLQKAVTRGNGEIGEVITNNAKVFKNLPFSIPFQRNLILRGEAIIAYSDFQKINAEIEDVEAKYKNPRNLCSGSVRQLNNEITAKRKVQFFAFSLVEAQGMEFENSKEKQMLFLKKQGFDIVEYQRVDKDNITDVIEQFEEKIKSYDIPSDGLVLSFDDLAYGISLGVTSKFPRDSIAFKWEDEKKETILKEIEWSASRTGLINPVAIFEPVELEGTTVARASVHNISILQSLKLGIGDRITVYKANMIIPQIAQNLTMSGNVVIPDLCPVCQVATQVKQMGEVKSLYCTNPQCQAKKIKAFTLLVSRDALNIDGLSEATLEKLIAKGFIHEFADLFQLSRYKDEIMEMDGFGEKSYENLMESIHRSQKTTLPKLIYALGIANIGIANAKMICRQFSYSWEALKKATVEELSEVEGVGEIIATAFYNTFQDTKWLESTSRLYHCLQMEDIIPEEATQTLRSITFVITGSLETFESRSVCKEEIEKRGGKVTGSVTAKTDYLVNNDVASTSSKNKKAKELNVPIITEQELIERFLS